MFLKKILLLAVIAAAVFAGYTIYQFWNKKIDPRRSFRHFIIYILVNLASVFVIVFITGFIIIHFKEFFFSK
ncbi:hypothetical protein [Ferruginibacter sp.]